MSDSSASLASPPVLDVESFLQPISDDSPVGEDIREDFSPTSVYYKIKDARNEARATERQATMAEDPGSAPRADWRPVADLAPQILKETSKDLEVAAWYVEALVRSHGLAGVRDGYRLIHRLCETFWDDVFPQPDEDGIVDRVAPLTGLNGDGGDGTLIAPIKNLPVTRMGSHEPFVAWQYERATQMEGLPPEEKERLAAEGQPTLSVFETAARESGAAFYRQLFADLEEARDAFAAVTAYLDEVCGYEAPPSSNVRKAFEEYDEILRFLTRDLLLDDAPAGEVEEGAAGVAAAGGGGGGGGSGGGGIGGINTRDDAFRALQLVADFFRRTEPHSPLSYNLEQAVRWGRMSLPELLRELIGDTTARNEFFKLSGIPVPEDEY